MTLRLPEVTSIAAASVAANTFTPPGLRSPVATDLCRVQITVAPQINIEVWLPSPANWNHRYEAIGGGGHAGTISYSGLAAAPATRTTRRASLASGLTGIGATTAVTTAGAIAIGTATTDPFATPGEEEHRFDLALQSAMWRGARSASVTAVTFGSRPFPSRSRRRR